MPIPLPQPNLPGAINPQQAAAAALANAQNNLAASSSTDPTQMYGDTAMNPSQQQQQDVMADPVSLAHAYNRYHSARSAGSMSANRPMMRGPAAQHIRQARVSPPLRPDAGAAYHPNQYTTINVPTQAEEEAQNTARGIFPDGGYTQAQDMAEHPDENFSTAKEGLVDLGEAGVHAFGGVVPDKGAEDYQASLQGTGKYAGKAAASALQREKLSVEEKKQAGKGSLLKAQPASPTPAENATIAPEGQAQAASVKPAAIAVAPSHIYQGRPIALKDNAWVFADTGDLIP